MIWKNIEIHNIGELMVAEDGSATWYRVPKAVREAQETDQGKNMSIGSTGVELRFVMNSPSVTIRLQSLSEPNVVTTQQLYYGGLQGGWDAHELNGFISKEPTDIVIKRPENGEMLQKMTDQAGLDWDPNVIRVIFNRGIYRLIDVIGDVQPPQKHQTPKKTLLVYGSSITHGSNALSAPNTWPSILAHNLNVDLINLGMAGSCHMEPEMVDYVARLGEEEQWDTATLELGINALNWEDEKIVSRVTNTLKQVAGRNPGKQIYVISPFYCHDDFKQGGKAEHWREQIERICAELNFPNVRYINGKDLLGDMSMISADEVHPNIYGVAQIAQRLTEILKR